jgi:hypothetical protein
LSLETGAQTDGVKSQPILGTFRNAPMRVTATKEAIIESLERAQ